MAKMVSRKWLAKNVHAEHRMTVYSTDQRMLRALPSLLRSFRDGRIKLGSLQSISDLGIKEEGDGVTLWSADSDKMASLQTWLEKKGYDTTGVF